MLISVHKIAIVGIKSLKLTIQRKYKYVKGDISNMVIVLAKMSISMHTSAITGIQSIILTIQANTKKLK